MFERIANEFFNVIKKKKKKLYIFERIAYELFNVTKKKEEKILFLKELHMNCVI